MTELPDNPMNRGYGLPAAYDYAIAVALTRIADSLEACKDCRGKGYVMTGPSLENKWDCFRCQGTGKWAGT